MKHRFHPAALAEYTAAAVWYGYDGAYRFTGAVDHSVDEVCDLPNAWAFWPGRTDVRHHVLRRFPYSVIYLVEAAEVVILAVAHQKRRPGYWLPRLGRRR